MKILVNISVLSKEHRGMGIFTKQIIKKLLLNNSHEYIFISANDLDKEINDIIQKSNHIYKQINTPLPIFEQIVVPYLILKYKPDLCWFPSNTFPILKLYKSKYIVTIHDMIFFNKSINPKTIYQKIGQLYRRYNIKFGIKKIDTVTSVSKTSLQEISTYFDLNTYNDKYVLYNSFMPLLQYDTKILKKFNIKKSKYLYSIAGTAPHKNLELLISAFLKLLKKDKDYMLVISGVSNSSYVKHDNIIFTPFISEAEKVSLIENAQLFIFPSLIEGFGIPLIEGLYYNPNVLVSDIKIFREIGKDYVSYFDPYDEDFLVNYFKSEKNIIDHKKVKEYIMNNFNIQTTTNKLENIFNEFR